MELRDNIRKLIDRIRRLAGQVEGMRSLKKCGFVRGNTEIIVIEPEPRGASAALGTITKTVYTMELGLFDFRCMHNDMNSVISGVANEKKKVVIK